MNVDVCLRGKQNSSLEAIVLEHPSWSSEEFAKAIVFQPLYQGVCVCVCVCVYGCVVARQAELFIGS